ncbi:hypothetical protein [Agrobacterium tumefaciens]|uniref:hypothetical protein n=1 Tax=Agrobacterium tumefaciens TaxID=358 RepID=UPI001571A4F2|nr:hypothetical protein [Agrobacterium tumefaciens]NTE37640.1 hypothetical protein [Agrobacterium tumefaciens]NTE53152.1 hypothetical protein [Agrobacterium tumefaciens]
MNELQSFYMITNPSGEDIFLVSKDEIDALLDGRLAFPMWANAKIRHAKVEALLVNGRVDGLEVINGEYERLDAAGSVDKSYSALKAAAVQRQLSRDGQAKTDQDLFDLRYIAASKWQCNDFENHQIFSALWDYLVDDIQTGRVRKGELPVEQLTSNA